MGGVGQSGTAVEPGESGTSLLARSQRRWLPGRCADAIRFELEAEQDRWFLWRAVAFGAGVALYFGASFEPPLWALGLIAAAALLVHGLARRIGLWGLATGFVFAMAIGAVVGKLRTEYMRAPVLTRPVSSVVVHGWVELVEPRPSRGQRVTMQVRSIDGLRRDEWPWRVRVRSVHEDAKLVPGLAVRVRATLAGPQPPSLPGDFDFGRYSWFSALGGIGLAVSPIVIEETDESPPLTLRLKAANEGVRYWITRRIMAALPGETGAIAAALITGERGGISDATNNAYRDSGLFHILSISGLHMVVMAGAIFALIRVTLAAVAPIALRFAIKKWAAGGALVGALGYLLISGSSFATVRSYLMISIMFVAVMLDRNAVALRNVALAAFAILIVFPESIFDPGFQMSFAAVTGLISIYEAIKRRAERKTHGSSDRGVIATGAAHFTGIITSTLIASAAVAPFGIYHFHNTQMLAMLANLVALPLCDIYVMPLALGVLIALPFGLEYWPLAAMGWGIDGMTTIARAVAALPGSVVRIPSIPTLSFLLMVCGGLWVLLWSRRWRLLGFLPIAAGLLWSPSRPRPDVIVSRDGTTIAVRAADGRLSAVAVRGGMFELARWLEYDGDSRLAKDVAAAQSFTCDALGCVTHSGGHEIAILSGAAGLRDHCVTAAVIVMRFTTPRRCSARRSTDAAPSPVIAIDPSANRSGNGHVLYFEGTGSARSIRVQTVEAARGERPWTRASLLAAVDLRRRAEVLDTGDLPRETNVPFATSRPDGDPEPDDDTLRRPGLRE